MNKTKKINDIFEEVIKENRVPKDELLFIKNKVDEFLNDFKKVLSKNKVDAQIFVGGSYARETLIKKKLYDVDVFVRFDKKNYGEKDLTSVLEKLLKDFKEKTKVHGSRDYFKIKISDNFEIEVIPVIKISKPSEAGNITDLSYSHVNYIKKKMNEKIKKEVILTKVFCQANNLYGAESYINGFSGYALELLIIKYKSFLNLIREVSKLKNGEKIFVDIEKYYKNKREIMMNLNESKLASPIILIDPTYKQRNALAALSNESFEIFRRESMKLISNPSKNFFNERKIDIEKIKEDSIKSKEDFVLYEIWTNKQEGDIAGSKLLKFYRHFCKEVEKFFDIKKKGFNYNGKHASRFFISGKRKKEIIINGPKISDDKNVKIFQKEHKFTYTQKGKFYAKEVVNYDLNKFSINWIKNNSKKIKEMYIKDIKIIE